MVKLRETIVQLYPKFGKYWKALSVKRWIVTIWGACFGKGMGQIGGYL